MSGVYDDDAPVTRVLRGAGPLREHASIDVHEISSLAAANPLLAAANPLLLMLRSLKVASAPGSVADLRSRLIQMVRDFTSACERVHIPEFDRDLASYALCATVDECIQTTPWGANVNWAQQSLLVQVHQDNRGGDRFFDILDRAERSPAKHGLLTELLYVCLSLGFVGRYHQLGPAGRQQLADRREKTYLHIRHAGREADRSLSEDWRPVNVGRRAFGGFGVATAVAVLLALVCVGIFAAYSLRLSAQIDALQFASLQLPALRDQPVVLELPAAKPRLAQLLRQRIEEGRLQVKDLQSRSIVTLQGEGMFDSGSATPLAAVEPLLDEVARALDKVEGNIVVNGYTDNVPARSMRFGTNLALSRARAAIVAERLGMQAALLPRMTSQGHGEADPVMPNTTPDGRARNRRVEIVLEVPNGNP